MVRESPWPCPEDGKQTRSTMMRRSSVGSVRRPIFVGSPLTMELELCLQDVSGMKNEINVNIRGTYLHVIKSRFVQQVVMQNPARCCHEQAHTMSTGGRISVQCRQHHCAPPTQLHHTAHWHWQEPSANQVILAVCLQPISYFKAPAYPQPLFIV